MATAGPRYPGTTASEVGPSGDNDWISTSPISADDGSEAQITAATYDANDHSYRLIASNFGFDAVIPAGSKIDGITVEIDRRCFAGAAEDQEVRLYDSTATLVGDDKQTATAWPATLQIATYGGATDTWNAGLDAADVRSANFGVALIVLATGANTDIGVDFIRVTIDYTPPQDIGALTLLDSARATYAPTVEQGAAAPQSIEPTLLDSARATYAPTVMPDQSLDLVLLDSSPAVYAPTVAPFNGLTLGLLDAARAVYGPATSITDTFTEASSTLLRDHTADSGQSWTHFWDDTTDAYQATIDPALDQAYVSSPVDPTPYARSIDVVGPDLPGGVDVYVTVKSRSGWPMAGPVARARIVGGQHRGYGALLDYGPDQVVLWRLTEGGGAIITAVACPAPPVRIRLHVDGMTPTTLRVKVWAAGDAEPAAWNIDTTDSTATHQAIAGAVGVAFRSDTTSADHLDDFAVASTGMGVLAEQTIDLPVLDSGAAIYVPTLAQTGGTQSLDLVLLDSGPTIYSPSVLADQAITLVLLDSGPAVYVPEVVPAPLSVVPGLLDSGRNLYQPTVVPGPVGLDLPLLDAGRAQYAPEITTGATIFATLLDSGPALFAPTVTPELLASLPLLDSGASVFAPTVSQLGGPQGIAPPLLDSAAAIYPPELVALATAILPLLDAGRAQHAPTLALGPTPVVLSLLDSGRAQYAPIVATAGRNRGSTSARPPGSSGPRNRG